MTTGDLKTTKTWRRKQALAFVLKTVAEWDFDPAEIYDPEHIIARAKELQGR
jgi:hypothetical protein